jgi:hypothetical protein
MSRSLRILTAVSAAGLLVALPAAQAYAYESVNLNNSWANGRGTIWFDSSDEVGFNLKLTDDAADGHCVYFQVQGWRDNLVDSGWERLTSDTCGSGTTRTYSGTKNIGGAIVLAFDGYRVKVCKNINNAPDVCSEASRIATRGQGSAG